MDIQTFKENGWEIRTVTKDGEPLFVANDMAKLLGYKDIKSAVAQHCKKVNKIKGGDSPFGVVDINVIPESDMFRLIMRSNLPKAEEFQDWVVEDVLPSIRKHGVYIGTKPEESEEDLKDRVAIAVDAAIAEKDKKILDLGQEIKDRNKALAMTSDSVDFKDYATNKGKEWSILDAKNDFGMSLSDFRSYLRSVKFFDKRIFQNGNTRWWPKPKFFNSGYVKLTNMGVNYAFTVKGMEWATVLIEDGPEDAKARFELERQLDLFDDEQKKG